MKSFFASALLCLLFISVNGQRKDSVSLRELHQVIIKGYHNPQEQLRAVGAVSVLDSNSLKRYDNSSLVAAVNSMSGVRMEERSPGSYRLSMRGSLLRSQFGIRNIKLYISDFPLTDAGGNTYLNLVDIAGIESIEVHKGPEGSSFGATTGGAVLISPTTSNTNVLKADLTVGSYGLLHQTVKWQQVLNRYRFNISQGYQEGNGYRENSALKRKYIQTYHQWNYSKNGALTGFVFVSDLNYQTPGGLTAAQLALNPRAARPATPTLPGAIAQQAGIFNETVFGGLSNTYYFAPRFKHVVAVFGASTNFENPFITNYEKRKENSLGIRTFLNYDFETPTASGTVQLGVEASRTVSDVENYGNAEGHPTTLQAADDLKANQHFSFLRFNYDINSRLLMELGGSLNFFRYTYQQVAPVATATQKKNFAPRLMPKFALSYLLNNHVTVRGSISKGYAPPTLAEIRSSDNLINVNLQAEYGWNYELGTRFKTKSEVFNADVNIFYFNLQDAIVRRLNIEDEEYFINSGGTKQFGSELQFNYLVFRRTLSSLLNSLKLTGSYTYSHFKFDNFSNAGQNYDGNWLTGVPRHTVVGGLELRLAKRYYLFSQYQYTSAIPLNDANTFFANHYHLVDVKSSVRQLPIGKTTFDVSFGINNLFNRSYSLGNDLNAASNRYYNPAMGINFYTSVAVQLF